MGVRGQIELCVCLELFLQLVSGGGSGGLKRSCWRSAVFGCIAVSFCVRECYWKCAVVVCSFLFMSVRPGIPKSWIYQARRRS